MTDLDRLLELYFIQTPNQFSDEYNTLKSEIEQKLEDSLGDKQQIGDLLAICDMKDEEIKQLKEDNEVLKLGEQESWSHYKINKQKLEKIKQNLVTLDDKEYTISGDKLKEILRGKEAWGIRNSVGYVRRNYS